MAIQNPSAHVDVSRLAHYDAVLSTELTGKFDGKVDKVTDSRLMTNTEGTKLGNIAEGAQVNVIEDVIVSGENIVTKSGKTLTIDLSAYAKSADYTSALIYKGTVASYSELPTEGMKTGDVYNITAADNEHNINAGDNVAYNGTGWDNLAGIVDLSGKVDKETGKGLSTNDFTNDLKTKLDNIAMATDADIDSIFSTRNSAE